MSQAEVAPSLAAAPGEDTQRVRVVGSRTFVLTDGVWVDTQFDPQQMRTTKVSFLSQDYFNLAAQSSELSGAFALGDRVIVVSSGIVYESITEGKADSIKPMTKATEISTPEKSFTNPQSSSAYPTPVVDPDETNTPETPILEVLISFLPWIGLIGVLFLAALIALKRM